MPGFSNITGLESIMYADNASFDGTERGGRMTLDGQVWIGASSSPYVRLSTLTSGNNITFVNGPGSITANVTGTTQYTVQVGSAAGALTSVGPGTAGQILQSGGGAANPAYSTATYPSTAGTSGNVLMSDGTNIVSTPLGGNSLSAGAVLDMVDDFLTIPATGAVFSTYYWATVGNLLIQTTAATRPGVIRNPSGDAGIFLGGGGVGVIEIGSSGVLTLQWYVKIGTLSDVTNRYDFSIGFMNRINGTPQVGLYFQYNDSVNSGNWQIVNNSGDGSPTIGNTTVAADTNWHVFKIIVNAGATSVAYYIDGTEVSVSPLSGDISSATDVSPGISVVATAGTVAASTMQVDLFTMRQVLTTAR